MATFVLIHGSWGGSWTWRWVTPLLRAAGHDVYAPTLTGLGARVHLANPRVGLDTHLADVANLLHHEDLTDVILVGWSYGGMVVAGVTDRAAARVAHVVYLDSKVPRDGDSSALASEFAALEEQARLRGDGWRVPLAGDPDDLPSELPAEMRRWITERLSPHPLKSWTQPIRLTGAAASIPTTYVRCTVGYDPTDEQTRRQGARIRGEPGWRYRELTHSHLAVWTAPQAVADVLLEAV